MGSSGSVLTSIRATLTKEDVQQLLGSEFDEILFNTLCDSNGLLTREQLFNAIDRPDIFITHDWGDDGHIDNHKRVGILNDYLIKKGFRTWYAKEGNMEKQIAGIASSKCVLVVVTKKYCEKVYQHRMDDYCQLEFNYADKMKGINSMIAVIFDKSMRDTADWEGEVGMILGGKPYLDITGDLNDPNYMESIMNDLENRIRQIISKKKPIARVNTNISNNNSFELQSERKEIMGTDKYQNEDKETKESKEDFNENSNLPSHLSISDIHTIDDSIEEKSTHSKNHTSFSEMNSSQVLKLLTFILSKEDVKIILELNHIPNNQKQYESIINTKKINGNMLNRCQSPNEFSLLFGIEDLHEATILFHQFQLAKYLDKNNIPSNQIDNKIDNKTDHKSDNIHSKSRNQEIKGARDVSHNSHNNNNNNNNNNNSKKHNNKIDDNKKIYNSNNKQNNNINKQNDKSDNHNERNNNEKNNNNQNKHDNDTNIIINNNNHNKHHHNDNNNHHQEQHQPVNSILIAGIEGDSNRANGIYEPMNELYGGCLRYKKKGGTNIFLEFDDEKFQWQIRVPSASKTPNGENESLLPSICAFMYIGRSSEYVPNPDQKKISSTLPSSYISSNLINTKISEGYWFVYVNGSYEILPNIICIPLPQSLSILGAIGHLEYIINGIYDPIPELYNGIFRYQKRNVDNICIEYVLEQKQWQIKRNLDKTTSYAFAYCSCPNPIPLTNVNSTWFVFAGLGNTQFNQDNGNHGNNENHNNTNNNNNFESLFTFEKQSNILVITECKVLIIQKCSTGIGQSISGRYCPTNEIYNGWIRYQHEDIPDIWMEYCELKGAWQIKSRIEKESINCIAFLKCVPVKLPTNLNIESKWHIYEDERFSIDDTMECLAIQTN